MRNARRNLFGVARQQQPAGRSTCAPRGRAAHFRLARRRRSLILFVVSKSAHILFMTMLVFWSVLVGVGDYFIINVTIRQFLARNFSTAQGRIVYSQVTQRRILRGGITIRYVYEVNGRHYGGSRYRYDDHNLAMRWEEAVSKFPEHARPTVYFNPKKPSESLLSPGVGGGDLLLLLLAAPVNVALLMLWSAVIARTRDRFARREAGGVKVIERQGQIRARLADATALAAGLYGIGGAAFFCSFPVVVLSGFDPSVAVMKDVWAAIFAAGLLAACWKGLINASGKYDLLIDHARQTVTLPETRRRPVRVVLPLDAITAVSLQKRVTHTRSGSYESYVPSLHCERNDLSLHDAPLAGWGWNEEKARAFGLWLSQRLGIEFAGVRDENPQATQ
jgi:hypothetical protein